MSGGVLSRLKHFFLRLFNPPSEESMPDGGLPRLMHSDILCPHCMEELRRVDILYVCPICNHVVKQSAVELTRMKAPFCKNPSCHKQIAKSCCKYCKKPLPFDILQYKKNLRFAMIGITGSGKTIFLTTMLTEARSTKDFPMILTWRENQTKLVYTMNRDILYRDKKRPDVTTPGVSPVPQQWRLTPRNMTETSRLSGKERAEEVYSLTVFDGPGESCENTNPAISRYIHGANMLIILFDPLALPSFSTQIPEEVIRRSTVAEHGADDNASMVEEVANYIRENCRINAKDRIDKDVAIVFTKIDEVLDSFGFGAVREPSPHNAAGGFVKRDADEVDREIRDWLKERGELSFLGAVDAHFDPSRVRFFGVSSFGRHPDDEGNPINIKPRRVLDPFYWMLSLEGVIPVITDAGDKQEENKEEETANQS